MTVLCGLDLATTSGIAIMQDDRLLHVEAYRPPGKTDDEIFHGFRNHLLPLLKDFGVAYVALEEPLRSDLTRKEADGSVVPISNMRTFLRLYGLRAHAIQICRQISVDWFEVNQSTWRKAFLRNGRGDKDAAMAQCKLMRWSVPNKDAAEACGVVWWLSGHLRLNRSALPGDLFAAPDLQGVA